MGKETERCRDEAAVQAAPFRYLAVYRLQRADSWKTRKNGLYE